MLFCYEHTPQNDIYDDGFRKIGSLTIPEGIRKVSDNIFRGYDIGWVKLPVSLKCLGENVFSGSHIGDIKLPENPRTQGDGSLVLTNQLDSGMIFRGEYNAKTSKKAEHKWDISHNVERDKPSKHF